jgi:plasmid stabilization system protein ParE
MMPIVTRAKPIDLLEAAINLDAYAYLESHAPTYLDAIDACVQQGMSPAEIGRFLRARVGPERESMALRCEQAAAYLILSQAAEK